MNEMGNMKKKFFFVCLIAVVVVHVVCLFVKTKQKLKNKKKCCVIDSFNAIHNTYTNEMINSILHCLLSYMQQQTIKQTREKRQQVAVMVIGCVVVAYVCVVMIITF